jgi:hypothetical protein
MLNERLQNVVKRRDGYYVWFAQNFNVKFHYGNAFAESLAIKRINGILALADEANGSPVLSSTLIRGSRRPDDIPLRDKIVVSDMTPPVEENPHRRDLKAFKEAHGEPKSEFDTKVEELEAEAKRWEEKQQAEKLQAEMESDPAWRARHVEAGTKYLIAHLTATPESEYQLLSSALAAVNDPVAYAQITNVIKARAEQRLAERDAELKAEVAKLEVERSRLNSETSAPTAEAWANARADAELLKRNGKSYYPDAADAIDELHAGIHSGSVTPAEYYHAERTIRETANATG